MGYLDKLSSAQYLIYGLIDPNTKEMRYIGRSSWGMRRPRRHWKPSRLKADLTQKGDWIRSLIEKGQRPDVEVIDDFNINPEQLIELERFYICAAIKLGCTLLNSTMGGEGKVGVKWIKKQRVNFYGPKQKRKMPPMSEETKRKLSLANKGMKMPESWIKSLKERNSNRVWKEESRIKTSRSLGSKPFVDNLGRRYETARGAARELGLEDANIRAVLKGRLKTTGGLTFKYIDT